MLSRILFATLFCSYLTAGYAQNVDDVDFIIDNNQIIVTYSLSNCDANKTYDVGLFYWQDNKVRQALTTEGDLRFQQCGGEKRIVWDVLSDQSSLTGNVQMEVRKIDEHLIQQEKTRRRKDHGYVAFLTGGFAPYKNFTPQFNYFYPSDNLEQGGAFVELTGSWLGRRQGIMGYTSSIRLSTTDIVQDMTMKETTWVNASFVFGPLFSIPISRRFVWDLRPMLGYSHTFVTGWSDRSIYYNSDNTPVDAGGLCMQLGTALRINVVKWFNLVAAADYFETRPSFNKTEININYISISFGCGVRF